MKKTIIAFIVILCQFSLLSQEGELDLSFNGDGKYILNLSNDDAATSVLIQPDEKILIGARIVNGPVTSALIRLDRYGNADPGFGNLGVAQISWPGYDPKVQDVALQSGGKILALASTYHNSESGVMLTRFNQNGTLDVSFANSGMAYRGNWYGTSYWNSVVGMPDGKIVVGGYAYFSGLGLNGVLLGFNENGSPNLAFGDSGIVKFSLSGNSVQLHKLMLTKNGKIIAAGSGDQGDENFLVAQFNEDGSFYSSFGGNGISTIPFGDNATAYDVAIQGDGKIVAVGQIYKDAKYQFALARLLPDGTLDQSFGSNGKVITQVMSGSAYPKSVVVLGDGKILVAGDAEGVWNRDFALVRYRNDGSLDPSFSLDGIATKNIGNDDDHARAAVLQPNGRMVVVGQSFDNGFNSNVISAARFLGGEGSIGIDGSEEVYFHLYPNPASDWLRVEMAENAGHFQLQLIDQRGSIIRELSGSGYEAELQVTDMNPGLYLLRISIDDGKAQSVKVMIVTQQ